MNIYGKSKIKDYDSLDETQNIKSDNYPDSEEIESNGSPKKKVLFLIGMVICLLIFFCIIFLIFKSKNTQEGNEQTKIENQMLQPSPLFQQNQNQNQSSSNVEKSQQFTQNDKIYQVYEIKAPLDLNISKYMKLFPKTSLNKKENTLNVTNFFKSKTLYINDKDITYDYIHYLRQNDKDEEKYKKEISETHDFNGIIPEREGQMSLQDFYKVCNGEKLDYNPIYLPSDKPNITIIIPVFNKQQDIVKTIRSIQNQSLKNLEIIIVDDMNTNHKKLYKSFFENEPRLRIFTHSRNIGVWRKRIDGFLYSNGEYILHINPGDILADNYVLEDAFNWVTKYNLDTVRFSFTKTNYNKTFNQNPVFAKMKYYPKKDTKIVYGRPNYNVHEFGYGTIWNRLVRNNMFTKGLDLVDEYIINARKDLWEDMWFNDLIDRVSFSNLVVNRLGYVFLYDRQTAIEPRIRLRSQRDKTIKEFILFWFFDYQLLEKEDNKRKIIDTLYHYNQRNNTFCRLPMRLDFLISKFNNYKRLLKLLIDDPFVLDKDKEFIKDLYKNYTIAEKKYEKEIKAMEKAKKEKKKNINIKDKLKKNGTIDVTQNCTNITQNYTNITQNCTNITQNYTNITQNCTNITQIYTNITQNYTNITQNDTNLTQSYTNITQNCSNITQNDANITQNSTNSTILLKLNETKAGEANSTIKMIN